jgi:hypothetical protein
MSIGTGVVFIGGSPIHIGEDEPSGDAAKSPEAQAAKEKRSSEVE